MKKRICFVYRKRQALKTLTQAVSGISSTWDCIFVTSGAAALEAMAAQPFDAVVAEMHLQDTNGAELLQRVRKLHPRTLRFILGDFADQELIISCIGGTHQFIAEPCDPKTLVATIQRGLALDAWLSTDQLRALVPKLERLPSLPSTYFEVLKQVESPHSSVQNIGDVIARDPTVTARLLQMVNSAALSLSEKVTDPVHAITLLGMETVKSLVLCLQVFSQNDQAKQAGISLEKLWTHSFAVAELAREIVLLQTGDARLSNDAFTAGLLHDVGRIVVASNMPKEYAAVVSAAFQQKRPLHEEETAQLGVTHAQVGAYLLSLWGMPAPLVEAAALHHTPGQVSTQQFSVLTAVHVANVFAHEQDNGEDGLSKPTLDAAYLGALGLADSIEVWRKELAGEGAEPTEVPIKSKPVPARAPAVVPAVSATPLPAKPAIHWFFKWLIPAAATSALVIAILLIRWPAGSGSNDLPIQARAVDPNPTPVAQPSGSPAAQTTAAATAPEKAVPPVPATPPAGADAATQVVASVTLEPEPVVAAAPAPISNVPRGGFDSLKVQGIFYRSANPSVIINGKALGAGERINGVEVVAIDESSVTLASEGQQKIVQVRVK